MMSVHAPKKPLRMIPALPQRAPHANIPQTLPEREYLRSVVQRYVEDRRESLVPPLVLDELRNHADAVVGLGAIDPAYRDYAGILINNEVWTEHLATVPFDRRLLLLPKCLRVEDKCPAPFDEFGLLCKQCGLCTIQDLQRGRAGWDYAVRWRGSERMALSQSGKSTHRRLSCLSVLERVFLHGAGRFWPSPFAVQTIAKHGRHIDWVETSASDYGRPPPGRSGSRRAEVETWFRLRVGRLLDRRQVSGRRGPSGVAEGNVAPF